MMAGRKHVNAVLRGVAAYAVLCLGSYFFGASLVCALAPAFKLEIESLGPEHKVTEFRVERAIVNLRIENEGGRQAEVQVRFHHFGFTYPILVLSLLAAWPFPSLTRRLLALGIGALLATAVVMIDLPAEVLLSLAERAPKKPFFVSFFFENGGRQFLALMIFLLSLAASGFASAWWRAVRGARPGRTVRRRPSVR